MWVSAGLWLIGFGCMVLALAAGEVAGEILQRPSAYRIPVGHARLASLILAALGALAWRAA